MRKDWLYAYNYGEAGFSLYAGEGATTENTLTPLFQISREYYLTLGNLRDSNQAIYNKALSSCLLMGLLAFAATVIVWMILSNTLVSAQEQGRDGPAFCRPWASPRPSCTGGRPSRHCGTG